jgi:Glycoside hydrolase family 44
VLWIKTNTPGVKLAASLHSASKSKGKEDTGPLVLSDFAPGQELDASWRRIVIPLSAFPDITQVDLKALHQVMFSLNGGYPENNPVTIYLDDVYLTNVDMVTPVSNLGYLVQNEGVRLEWDKDPAERVQQFAISVNGKPVLKVDGKVRSAFLPVETLGRSETTDIGVASMGASESSDEQKVKAWPRPPSPLTATVRLGAPAHDISPYIFGTNFGPTSALKDLGVTVRRWGGNRTSKYNWKYDVDSAGSDWYFLNDYSKPAATPENKKNYYQFISETLASGSQVNFCLPIGPWIAKPHGDEKQRYCSFPVSVYPQQEKTDGQGCGNGKKPDGEPIWDNDPSLSMVRNSPDLQREFVQTVVKLFGPASRGGVAFYCLDNEPGLWMYTHRDAVPKGVSAEQLAELDIQYAGIVKSVDPSAKVIGFAAWGVKELAGSNEDYLPPGPDGYKHEKEGPGAADVYRERKKHGGSSQLVYLLKRFKEAEQQTGKRLVDVVDIHWYPELYGKDSKGEAHRVLDDLPFDKTFAKLQWEAVREWYDRGFKLTPELDSWTGGSNAEYLYTPFHPVIPALKQIVEANYPGTKLAINEYDTGSTEHYHGALLRAAVLGIFMQEDLFMAQNWHQTDDKKFTYWAQKLYRNYDGKGGHVGGKFVPSQSSQPDLLSYAALDGDRFTVVLVNKNTTQPIQTTVELPTPTAGYRTYTLAETLNLRLLERASQAQGKPLTVVVPAYAAVLLTTDGLTGHSQRGARSP